MMSDDNIHHHLSSLSSLHNKIVENVFVRLCWFCQNLHQFSTCDIVDEKRCYDIIILYCIVLYSVLFFSHEQKKIIPCPLVCRVSTIWGFVAIGLCRKILQQSDSTDFSPTIWMYHSPPPSSTPLNAMLHWMNFLKTLMFRIIVSVKSCYLVTGLSLA